jgi:uncharacterized protein (UPF0333 family)
MNKKLATALIVLVVIVFLGYIIYDVAFDRDKAVPKNKSSISAENPDKWVVKGTIDPASGRIKTVTVMDNGSVIIGGESFIACYDAENRLIWNKKLDKPVTSLSVSGDTLFASTAETILRFNSDGSFISEWGPFEDSAMITSVASNRSFVVFGDAANRIVMVLNKKGDLKSMIGKNGEPFVIPSPYFDVAIDAENNLFVANTGSHRIEKRDLSGKVLYSFGDAGTAPDSFCGCCNPAHFTLIPGGFVTAEKGINRIKILNTKGEFVEFVSSVNDYVPSIPLDVATFNGKIIYAANQADSKVYKFTRK